MNRDEVLDKLARGRDKWFDSLDEPLPYWLCAPEAKVFWSASMQGYAVAFDAFELKFVYESDWLQRRIELGLEKAPDPEVTPEEDEAWNEARMDAIGLNGGEALHYDVTPAEDVEFNAGKSDGSTASYYELPEGCTELQDLISHRNLNAQDGEMFRAIYRKGRASHSDELRDAKKVLFYAQAEVDRLMKLEGNR